MDRDSSYDYKYCRLIVMKVGSEIRDSSVTYIDGTKGKKRDLHLEIEWLEAGEYLIFVEFDWPVIETPNENIESCQFALTTYGSADTEFGGEDVTYCDSPSAKIDILSDVFRSKIHQNSYTQKVDLGKYGA